MQKTLVIIKPDALKRGLAGKVMDRLETKGLKLVACKMTELSEDILKEHYSHIADKPFFPEIRDFMMSAPVVLQIWEGVECVEVVRNVLGVTNARVAAPGTIRGDFAMSVCRNLMHASEDLEAAEAEIKRFFSEEEIYSFSRVDERELNELSEIESN